MGTHENQGQVSDFQGSQKAFDEDPCWQDTSRLLAPRVMLPITQRLQTCGKPTGGLNGSEQGSITRAHPAEAAGERLSHAKGQDGDSKHSLV